MMKQIFLIFLLLLAIVGCDTKNGEEKKVLNLALSSKVDTLDPALSYDTNSASVLGQVAETLLQYNYTKRPYTLEPLLAKKMPEVSEDGLIYTIELKSKVPYHSYPDLTKGRTVTAEDFVTQIKRVALKSTRSPGWWLFDGRIEGLNEFREKIGPDLKGFTETKVAGLEVLGEHKLRIKLTRPYPQFKYALAMFFSSPVPAELVVKHKNQFPEGVPGTGAFYLNSWTHGSRLVLKRFAAYHAPKAALKKVNYHVMPEAQTRWLNFLNGKLDFIALNKDNYSLAVNEKGELREDFKEKNIELRLVSTLTYWWLSFNMTDPVVGDNLKLRQAIAHAIDFEKYIQIFTYGVAKKANSIYPPGVAAYKEDDKLPYEYNPAKAKQLLAEAGHPGGKGLPTLKYDLRSSTTVSRQMGEFIKKELAQIGINVKVIQNPFNQFLRKAKNGELQFWQGGWALDYPDAENIVQLLYSKNFPPGPNASYFKNQELDQLYQKISSSTDKDGKLSARVAQIVNEELPWIMQYYSRDHILYYKSVKNYIYSDLIYNNLKYLDKR